MEWRSSSSTFDDKEMLLYSDSLQCCLRSKCFCLAWFHPFSGEARVINGVMALLVDREDNGFHLVNPSSIHHHDQARYARR